MKSFYITLIGSILLIAFGFYMGYEFRQHEIRQNAEKVFRQRKTSFDVQDIEIIIFDEPQL
jgi:hypothetical protein